MKWGLLVTALLISSWHAMMPTHWLPFVLAGKACHWDRLKLLFVTLIAGSCHAVTMLALGLVAWFVGRGIEVIFSSVARYASSLVLFLVGFAYMVSALFSPPHDSDEDEFVGKLGWLKVNSECKCKSCSSGEAMKIERFVIVALVLALTLSPCQAILPLFFAAAASGFESLFMLMLLTGVMTILAMASTVMLASFGLELFKLRTSERHEKMIVGLLCVALALLVLHH